MDIALTKETLVGEVLARGIPADKRWKKADLADALAKRALAALESPSWGLIARLAMKPMLCASYANLKPAVQTRLWEDARWVAEPKLFGCRALITYHPEEGFSFWSRHLDPHRFLPIDWGEKLLLVHRGRVSLPPRWRGLFPTPFILDGEIYCPETPARVDHHFRGLEQNVVSAVLSLPAEEARERQIAHPFCVGAFDCLSVGDAPVWARPFRERRAVLDDLLGRHPEIPVEAVDQDGGDKKGLYRRITETGGEGIVFKHLDKPYAFSRDAQTCVKLRRDMLESETEELDAFVLEAEGGGADGLVDGLKLGVYVRRADGVEEERHVATVTDLPLGLRLQLTERHPVARTPVLKREYYGRVLPVRVSKLLPGAKRFLKAAANWAEGFRTDKTRFDCVVDETALERREPS